VANVEAAEATFVQKSDTFQELTAPEPQPPDRLDYERVLQGLNLTQAEVQTLHGMLRQIAYKLRQQDRGA
jgi:tRNA C32,U32 (ribose-2'-O)-methylase TrmJ